MDGTSSKSPNKEYSTQFSMSGGPPQHPHGRQVPPNTAWNHLQVPNFYAGRQPQHAHMSSDLSMLATHQPTWHTPTTTEPTKGITHSPLFNLQQMLGSERPYARHSPGVDLTLTRNGNQNGDIPQTPISLSVRDTKQINSLPLGAALDGDRAVELTKGPSPGLTSSSSSGSGSGSSSLVQDRQPSPKNQHHLRRPAKRMDSIIDRLNTSTNEKLPQSVIVTAAATTSSSHDENSNSSQGTAIASGGVPTPNPIRDDEVASPISNEDSLDSNKSRRKRKPCKTVKVSKDDDIEQINEKLPPTTTTTTTTTATTTATAIAIVEQKQTNIQPTPPPPPNDAEKQPPPPRRRSSSEPPTSPTSASKSRRKTVSESETIDNIAAMVAAAAATATSSSSKEENSETVIPTPIPLTVPTRTPPPPPVATTIADNNIIIQSENIPNANEGATAKPVSVITRDHSNNCSNDSLTNTNTNDVVEVGNIASAEPSLNISEQTQGEIKKNPSEASAAPQMMLTLAQKKGETQCFVAVEDELEKMFAGIADQDSEFQPDSDPLAIASTSTSNQQHLNESVSSTSNDLAASSCSKLSYKRGRPKSTKGGSRRPSDSNSTESTPRKKHKGNKKQRGGPGGGDGDDFDESLNKNKMSQNISNKSKKNKKGGGGGGAANKQQLNSKVDVVKDIYSYDSGSNASSSRSKGPFIQIKGPRDSPISVNIVNTPCNEDDPDKPSKQFKNKKFHDDSEYRHKVRSKGLHCSTLSNKYDAQTRDATWICVFCKRGPHATDPLLPGPSPFTLDMPQYSPGDLFGPYIISTDCPEYQRRLDDPFDVQYKSKKCALTAAAITGLTPTTTATTTTTDTTMKTSHHGKKAKKRLNSESSVRDSIDGGSGGGGATVDLVKDVMLGIAEVTPTSFEVWVHEDCVIWSPGVYLVGPKIIGLEGAVWGACSVACKRCGLKGAAICCIKRGCGSVMHIGCAKLSNWKLDEDNYKAYCTAHIVP